MKGNDINNPDWETVNWSKPIKKRNIPNPIGSGRSVETQKKFIKKNNATEIHAHKLETTEELKHSKVSFNMKMAIQKARLSKGWSQQDLAQRINVKPTVINQYESGKAIPDSNLINKLQKVLGAKLR